MRAGCVPSAPDTPRHVAPCNPQASRTLWRFASAIASARRWLDSAPAELMLVALVYVVTLAGALPHATADAWRSTFREGHRTDLDNSYEPVRSMLVLPIDKSALILLLAAALAPMLPLLLTMFSLKELVLQLVSVIF